MIVTSLIVQQSYTNKALDIFTSGLVIPVNYIVFNISTITGYIILFQVCRPPLSHRHHGSPLALFPLILPFKRPPLSLTRHPYRPPPAC